MSEPQKITTEIILAEFIPPAAQTPELAREITTALRAENQAALEQIIQRTQQAFALQQRQIDQIAKLQQAELNQIRQEIKRLSQQPTQPKITYNISDNRSINYIQSTSNSWNSYSQNTYSESNHNQNNYTHNTYQSSWGTHKHPGSRQQNHSQAYDSNQYNRQQNHSQGYGFNQYNRQLDTYTEEDSAKNCLPSLGSWWPLPIIVLLAWGAWACENQQKTQQTPPAIQRTR